MDTIAPELNLTPKTRDTPLTKIGAHDEISKLSDGVWDIVAFLEVASNSYEGQDALKTFDELQKLSGEFFIGPDSIGQHVARACQQPGFGINRPATNRRYSIIARRLGEPTNDWHFDSPASSEAIVHEEGRHPMHLAVRLLRIVRPNHIGFGSAARVRMKRGMPVSIYPNELVGAGSHAFIDPNPKQNERGIRRDDLELFNSIWNSYARPELPNRVRESLTWLERASWERSARSRIPLSVISAECLVNTSDHNATRQFILRMQGLIDLGVLTEAAWDGGDLYSIYSLRSALLHGRSVGDSSKVEVETLIGKLEASIRCILRKAILEPEFASNFADDESLDAFLPAHAQEMKLWYTAREDYPLPSWAGRRS
jgi:hypothetical protein